MRPVPVPDFVRELPWVRRTQVVGAPDGDLLNPDISPVEAVYFRSDRGDNAAQPMVGVVLMLEDEDVEAIKAGTRHVLMLWEGYALPVFIPPVVLYADDTPSNQEV